MRFAELGELVAIQTGKLDANAASSDGEYPFFTCARETLTIDSWKYDLDAVLVAGNGDLNVKHYHGRFEAYQRTYILNVKEGASLDTRYLFYFMDNYLDALRAQSIGGIIKYIKLGMLAGARIPLPPLEEQKRIAAILDQADSLRRLRQRAIDRLNTLGQAIFYEMFGDPKTNSKMWKTNNLGEVSEFYSGNSLPDGKAFEGEENGYFLLKVSDLNIPENSREIRVAASWSPQPGSRAGTCPENSVVFPKRGGAIGTNKKRLLKRKSILDPNLMGVSPKLDVINSEFLFGWFGKFNLSDIASGSSVPQLNKQDLHPQKIILPPIDLQEIYAERIENLVDLEIQETRHLLETDHLFMSLQNRAFRGEL